MIKLLGRNQEIDSVGDSFVHNIWIKVEVKTNLFDIIFSELIALGLRWQKF